MDIDANSFPSGFFKVVHAQSLWKGSLRFPNSFVDHHGHSFPKYACLEVPTGATWKVELRKSEGRVWLQNGWREFAEFYSIEEGYFLVFKHEGGCFFHVLIFSKTGLEVKYPVGSAFTTPKVTKIKEEEVYVSSDYDHACPRKSHEARRGPLVNQSRKRLQVEESGTKKKIKLSAGIKQQLKETRQAYRRRFIEKVGIFKSEKPHFILYMTPNFIAHKGVMRVPAAHFRRYIKECDNHGGNEILVRGWRGRSWRVQYRVTYRNMAIFTTGWRQFVEENEVQAGDVCVFEMVNRKAKEYEVTTFSVGEYA